MPNENQRAPRRRPVDVLFGEEVELKPKPSVSDADPKQSAAGYMVEAPRPVTTVRPPPPEFPSDWRISPLPEPAAVIELPLEMPAQTEPIVTPPNPPVVIEPVVEPIAEAVAFTPPPGNGLEREPRPGAGIPQVPAMVVPPSVTAPAATAQAAIASAAAPFTAASYLAPTAPAPLYGQTDLLELSQFVDQLFQNVADETSDSADLNAECLTNLNAARARIEKGEYAGAEAAAESVKARLLRARASRAAAALLTTKLLYAGLIAATIAGAVLFAVPFVLRIVPVVIPLLRGAGLGMLGGAAIALWQLAQRITKREYDAAYNIQYALSPLFGALIGAVLYLLALLGILAAPNALGINFEPYALMYLFALLGGIFNDAVIAQIRAFASRQRSTA